jgi:hypothetical protein
MLQNTSKQILPACKKNVYTKSKNKGVDGYTDKINLER